MGAHMKILERKSYLKRLLELKDTNDIKIITGIRRSGKSMLLKSFIDILKSTNEKQNIIYIDLSLLKNEHLLDYKSLYNFVISNHVAGLSNYLFVDEIQLCKGFEKAINSLHSENEFSIYLTGSNAFLLSSDLATFFTGRAIEISMFPFSFSEFCEYFNYTNTSSAFDEYVEKGGMPGSYQYKNPTEQKKYLAGVYETILMRDLFERYNMQNKLLLRRLGEFMLSNISNLSSLRNIANFLTTHLQKVNHRTVGEYISYMVDAFLFYKTNRYDIQGKAYLATIEKYYLVDHGFRTAVLGTKNMDYGRVYENIIAIELYRRGYEIYVGKLYQNEIDFVAIKESEKLYIQVSDDISSRETLLREISPLLKIKDGYPKILLANTKHPKTLKEGIPIIDIGRWLLGKE